MDEKQKQLRRLVRSMRRGFAKSRPLESDFVAYNGKVKACALGAVAVAEYSPRALRRLLDKRMPNMLSELPMQHERYGLVLNARVVHPVTGGAMDLEMAVMSLNDDYLWPREAIAAWLDALALASLPGPETAT